MRYFLMSLLFVLTTSCEKKQPEVCKMLFKSVSVASQAIAVSLQCENEAAIAADLSVPISKLALCDVTTQSAMSDFLCPQLAQMLTTLTVNSIPSDWKCTATIAGDIVKQKVSEACVSIVK